MLIMTVPKNMTKEKASYPNDKKLFFKKTVLSVDAVNRPGVLIPQRQAGGFHGHSIELPNEKACYQLRHRTDPNISIKMFGQH